MNQNVSPRSNATDNVQQSSGDLFGYEMNIDAMSRALIIMPRLLSLSDAADATPAALDELRDRVRSLTSEVALLSETLAHLRVYVDGLPVDERDSHRRHLYGR